MSVPLSDTRLTEPTFGVVFDRPDADRNYAWGPFAGFDTAARFAEFVEAEIDPAHVIPWQDAVALPGVRVLDPVAELLTWRTTVALQQNPEVVRCAHPECPKVAAPLGWAREPWLCAEHDAAPTS